jgi:hypothetical protein
MRVGLVLEFGVGRRDDTSVIFVIASLVGRSDTITTVWPTYATGCKSSVLEDIMLEADQLVTEFVRQMVGIQEVLPLD